MLKTTILPEKLNFERLKISDNKVNRYGVGNIKELAKQSRKLKSQKLSKSKKLAMSKNSSQKVRIYLNLVLRKLDQTF